MSGSVRGDMGLGVSSPTTSYSSGSDSREIDTGDKTTLLSPVNCDTTILFCVHRYHEHLFPVNKNNDLALIFLSSSFTHCLVHLIMIHECAVTVW